MLANQASSKTCTNKQYVMRLPYFFFLLFLTLPDAFPLVNRNANFARLVPSLTQQDKRCATSVLWDTIRCVCYVVLCVLLTQTQKYNVDFSLTACFFVLFFFRMLPTKQHAKSVTPATLRKMSANQFVNNVRRVT